MLKKIEYRINYRSTREMDLIFRKFWSDFKNDHSEDELKIFKRLIDESDVDIAIFQGFSKYARKIIHKC